MIKRKHEILFDIGKRHLVYPLDVTFIRDLAPAFARKWIQAGWDIGKTALLEINHPTIPA